MKKNTFSGVLYSGQAVIIVLLIMVIALTVGISISLRSSTNTRLSTRTEESQRAFSAAEAGLEAALIAGTGTLTNNTFGTNSKYEATNSFYGNELEFIFPEAIARDDTQQLWLVSHYANGDLYDVSGNLITCNNGNAATTCYTIPTIYVCWGDSKYTNDEPAIEATLIYLQGGVYKITKYAYDAKSRAGTNNGFVLASANNKCSKGSYYATLTFPNTGGEQYIALRLRLMYNVNKQAIVVKSTDGISKFPYQGEMVVSTGKVYITGQNQAEVRTLHFYKSYPYLPGIFDFALFSSNTLTK